MTKIVTFGEIMGRIEIEHNYRFSQALPGSTYITFAGAEANVAASLSLLGRTTQFVSALPDNPISLSCLSYLRGLNVGTDHIHMGSEGRFGLYFLETGANQRPSNVIYDRDYSSISVKSPSSYDWDFIFKDASWFHVSGITPAISENTAIATIESVKKARQYGVKVSCDLNYRKKLWNWDSTLSKKELARKTMKEVLPYVDVIIGNEEDASDILNINPENVDVHAGKLDVNKYIDVAKKVVSLYPSVSYVAFTLRESISASHNNWGAMLYDVSSKKSHFSPIENENYSPYEIRNIIDRVGGGDSFSAGLIYAFTDSKLSSPEKAISFATASSCLCHSIHGDINFSTKEDIIRLMDGNTSGRVIR